MKGAVLSMILFCLFILPFFLYFSIQSIQENAFLKTTTEVQEMVESYGGVTDEVQAVVDNLNKKGYVISFTNSQSGQSIMGAQPPGTVIRIDYQYRYNNVYKEQTLKTTNFVKINRRE